MSEETKTKRVYRRSKYANHDEYKEAMKQKMKEWKVRNREKALEYSKEYYKNNKEEIIKKVVEAKRQRRQLAKEAKEASE